jgi:hypothetical protein
MPPPVKDVDREGFRQFLLGTPKTPDAGTPTKAVAAKGKVKEKEIER